MNTEVVQQPDVPMVTIKSSNLRAYGYVPGTRVLRIEFSNGSRYDYADVPADAVEEFAKSSSKGRHFATAIRGKYLCSKIEHRDEEA